MRALAAILATTTTAALVVVPALPAGATTGEWEPVASYCSPSGDVCFGIRRSGERVQLRLDSFVDFGDVSFCVKKAGGRYRCHTRTLQPGAHNLYSAAILWNRHYPTAGPTKRVVRFAGYPKRLSFLP